MRENPMLGTRGVRLGIMLPDLTRMQVRAIFEAAAAVVAEGVVVKPEVMIPLITHANELGRQREVLETEAQQVMLEQGISIEYQFGTMIEIPRAALTAAEIAQHAEFFSFGTNDLTQTTFGMSRDDAEAGFLISYLQTGILEDNPFATLDAPGVGRLMAMTISDGRGDPPRPRDRHLWRARRRPPLDRRVPQAWARLCLLFAIPRACRPAGCRSSGHRRSRRAGEGRQGGVSAPSRAYWDCTA